MIAVLKQIEQRPIVRPQYARASTYAVWLQINSELVWDYWSALERAQDADPERAGAYVEFSDFARCQYDITSPAPGLTGTALECTRAEPEGSEGHSTAGCGPVVAGDFSESV